MNVQPASAAAVNTQPPSAPAVKVEPASAAALKVEPATLKAEPLSTALPAAEDERPAKVSRVSSAPSEKVAAPAAGPKASAAVPAGYVTHDRYGKPLAKPRPATRREKCAVTQGKGHLVSAETYAALTAAAAAGVELPKANSKGKKRGR